ncbi:aldehyde dehydrogenase (NADP(+)) [Pseudonocardia acaciae]|uniref:aldehyde dehydrogenase (NADP(+)) n=1 Tax=Pseudonocardia acaciae TaxID=551276 RepID=UPI00048AA69D|nr:aldehyde dehydrogenase (NADP(+)) [Pseudonocardia acaciae]
MSSSEVIDSVPETTDDELNRILSGAAEAAGPFGALPPKTRAAHLVAVADALHAHDDELVELAIAESGLPDARLRGELNRTAVQLRLFAEVLARGAYLDVVLDAADPDFAIGPRPDLRRVKLPIGPVLVYAASNFPFAFSVIGGDSASALAAGCPVVLKSHPGHPRLSARTGQVVADALRTAGAPDGVFAVIHGDRQGVDALRDERIAAAAFTGSVAGGRALFDIAAARPRPIPFFGELGSNNPVFVTPGAVRARGAEIARGYVESFTLGVGQFCTKPGLLFLPADHGLEDALVEAVRAVPGARMLTEKVSRGYGSRHDAILAAAGVRTLVDGGDPDGLAAAPTLAATDSGTLLDRGADLLDEAFGPLSIVVGYDKVDELPVLAAALEPSLTATVHLDADDPADTESARPLVTRLAEQAGRVLFNGWPTGVAVTPAMHHGGPYPSTTAPLHTSVGSRAIDRFLRPVVFQNAPAALLPDALRDDNPLGLPRETNPAGESRTWGS